MHRAQASECPTTAILWQLFDPLLTLFMTSSLILDLFMRAAPTRRLLPAHGQRGRLQRTCIINKVYLGKILNRNLG